MTKIIQGDCIEIMKCIPSKSIDLVMTDPPYGLGKGKIQGDNNDAAWMNAIPECARVLKDDTFYLTFCSVAKIPEVIAETTKFFKYRWMNIFYINNGMVRGSVGFSKYHPVLVFMKGKATIKKQMCDVFETSGSAKAMAERFHPYQKDARFIAKHIETFSDPGDLILDPFIGSGQTAIACQQLGRRCIGIDIEEQYCQISRKRLIDATPTPRSFS